ncbi:MAG: chemotaxis protein CheW [Gammaproteobacteria bacterium]|nr:chemotaxis protein CheW [Gammaproteobacteria bacterium]MBU3997685.1 chemotaxis protein CheW [Gammaproteobacteria bacterium]MBU4019490.1 chemotaxis protein CheW [Gammaproteobacteria bacterium]MBU4079004.1 chemotaxis protein CheW [Gammaproteobacteria bacterium]MBU4115374.1 chemotaxis protein CheW [Gammaproteobacteria bacterium]
MNTLVKVERKASTHQVAAPAAVEEKQYLTFMLGGEMFALSILSIKEIIWYANLTEVPMMPACIRGVINLRGAVVPVMDLSNRFGKPSTAVIKSSCIVIVEVPTAAEGEHQNMGIVVDSVQAVLEIPTTEIEPAPSFGAKIRSEFIEGIAKVNGKFVILLNVANVLSMEEIGQMGQLANLTEGG